MSDDLFVNRTPTEDQGFRMDAITAGMQALAAVLEEHLPPANRFKSLAFTKLEECSMWAKKCVVFG